MTRFLRRPLLLGNTNTPVRSVPALRGQVRRQNADLKFAGLVLPATLRVEINAVMYVVPLSGTDINTVISDINTVISVGGHLAVDRAGVIHIQAGTGGEGTFVRVHPFVGGPSDASFALGFPRHPDPQATVDGGDVEWAPFGVNERNPLGTIFASDGEDVTAEVLNRTASALASNVDQLELCLEREIALPMIIKFDDPAMAPRLHYNGAGDVEQVDLSGLAAVDSAFSNRVYLGKGLDNVSTLGQLANYFAVTDMAQVEIIVGGRPVRVAAVTHGKRSVGLPAFPPDDVSPPTSPVANVATWAPLDGRSLLGVDFVKATAGIDEVLYRTALRSVGATFLSAGVVDRDKAVISGATQNEPFNHNGTYTVEKIIDEEHLLLRGAATGDRGELNPVGVTGSVSISSGGLFAEDVFLTFQPAIPLGRDFKIVVGGGYRLCDLPTDHLLRLAISTSEEVDDLVQKVIREMKGPLVDSTDDFTADPFAHEIIGGAVYKGEADVSMELLWRRITLQGAYDGQGRGAGGGYFVFVDSQPPEFNNLTPKVPQAGTSAGEGSGIGATILAGNVVNIVGHNFTLDDIGKHLVITGGTGPLFTVSDPGAQFMIIDYIDSENAVLEPGESNPSIPPGGSYTWKVKAGAFSGMPAAFTTHVLQGNTWGRLGFVHEEDRDSTTQFGHDFLGIREVTEGPGGQALNTVIGISFVAGSEWVTLPFDPTETSNIRTFTTERTGLAQSIVKITHTDKNDGWYLVVDIDGPTQRLRLMNFDGTFPSFTVEADPTTSWMHFYLPTQGPMDVRLSDSVSFRVGRTFFEDALEWKGAQDSVFGTSANRTHLGVIGVDWRGPVYGGLVMALNDDGGYTAYRQGDAASGAAIYIDASMPAHGIVARKWSPVRTEDLGPLGGPVSLADAMERGGWAGFFTASTHAMDMEAADPDFLGAALVATSTGDDPALVLIGDEDPASEHTSPHPLVKDLTYLKSKATLVVARHDDWSMMQSGARETVGAGYTVDPRYHYGEALESTFWGGEYNELPATARFSLSPQSVHQERYWITDGPHLENKRSRLGQPALTIPNYGPGSGMTVNLSPPDPSVSRSVRSSGFMTCALGLDMLLLEDLAAYVGQQVSLKTDPQVAALDGYYVIINAQNILPEEGMEYGKVVFEVYRPGTVFPSRSQEDRVKVHGSRWHFGNVDIEHFSLIGTGSPADDLDVSRLSFLGSGSVGFEGSAWTYGPFQVTSYDALADYASGLGGSTDDVAGAFSIVSPTMRASRWPITNEAWTGASQPLGDGGTSVTETNPTTGDFVIRTGVGYTGFVVDTAFDQQWGGLKAGAIRFAYNNAATGGSQGSSTISLLVRASARLVKGHYNYRVRLRLMTPNIPAAAGKDTKTIKVSLVTSPTWNAPAISLEKDVVLHYDGAEEFFELDFHSEEMGLDLRELYSKAIVENGDVFLRLQVGETLPVDTAASEGLYVFQAAIETRQTAQHSGHLLNGGQVVAAGFHLHTRAMDWKSYGPASAGPFASAGYGQHAPIGNSTHPTDSPTNGAIEYPAFAIIDNMRFLGLGGTWDEDNGGSEAAAIDITPPSWYWYRGHQAATFMFLDRRWSLDEKGVGSRYLPSRAGHSVPLDPPHGSQIASLRVGVSIKPAVAVSGHSGEWCVWNSWKGKDASVGAAIVPDRPGFTIELVRYSVLLTEVPAPREFGTDEVAPWQHGFAEVLVSQDVDLDPEGPPALAAETIEKYPANGGPGDDSPIGPSVKEHEFVIDVDLTGISDNKDMVDRRQYSYALTVTAWGIGQTTTRLLLDSDLLDPPTTWGIVTDAGGGMLDPLDRITKLNFRGAVMGCNYSRINP